MLKCSSLVEVEVVVEDTVVEVVPVPFGTIQTLQCQLPHTHSRSVSVVPVPSRTREPTVEIRYTAFTTYTEVEVEVEDYNRDKPEVPVVVQEAS
jgi:hypothetical protein